ncbi:MAG: hypothetical protein AMXMBFR56_72720 [Polyangiaceae bacterium]
MAALWSDKVYSRELDALRDLRAAVLRIDELLADASDQFDSKASATEWRELVRLAKSAKLGAELDALEPDSGGAA